MTCSGSSGSPAPAGGHMVAGLYLAQWCQSTRQRWPKHTLRRSSWAQCVCPGSAQAHASPGRGLFGPIDHADLTCTLRPTATFFMSSYLFSLGNLGKEVLFLLQEWRQLFFFFFFLASQFFWNESPNTGFLSPRRGGRCGVGIYSCRQLPDWSAGRAAPVLLGCLSASHFTSNCQNFTVLGPSSTSTSFSMLIVSQLRKKIFCS